MLQLISFDTPGYQNVKPSMKRLVSWEEPTRSYFFKLTFPITILKVPRQHSLYPSPPANAHVRHILLHTHKSATHFSQLTTI